LVLCEELGAAPRVASLPAGRFVVRSMRSSRWRSRTSPTPLAPRQMLLALLRDSATQTRVYPSFASFPHLAHLSTYLFLCRDCAQTSGWSGGEGRDASSKLGSDEAGDDGSDKATRAAIARAYEVDRGDGGGKSGRRKGGEGGGGRGRGVVGGWLSGFSAAAPEVPPD
jgi:hypothetical protein